MKEQKKWIIGTIVVFLIALGTFLRLFRLGQPLLWIDEITITWFAALPRTAGQIIQEIFTADMQGFTGQHMPLQYVLLNFFYYIYKACGINDVSEFLTRLPFALSGILALPLMYLTSKRFWGSTKLGLWSLFLLSISFFHVLKSRDATGYAPLILCILLNSYGAVGILLPDAEQPRRKLIVYFIAFIVGTIGAFMTHLTSWLYLAPEGMIMLGCTVLPMWKSWRKGDKLPTLFKSKILSLIALMALLVMALCFIHFPLAVTKGHGIYEDIRESLGVSHLLYQIAHFSWGKGAGRLISAILLLLAAFVAGWKKYHAKVLIVATLWVIPAILIAILNFRGFHPRYMSVILPVHITILALGCSCVQELITNVIKHRHTAAIYLGMVALLLTAWLWGPYRALFLMHSIAFPIYEVRETLQSVLEPDAPYIWQNAFQARQLGQTYMLPGHACINGMYPNGTGEPKQQFLIMDQNLRHICKTIPNAPMIIDRNDLFFLDQDYQWPHTFYNREIPVKKEPWLKKFHEWGFMSVGFDPDSFDYHILYNTTDDIVNQIKSTQGLAIWPQDKVWQFQRLQNGIVLIINTGPAALTVANFNNQCNQVKLRITGFATGNGAVMITGANLPPSGIYSSFQASGNQAVTMELGHIPVTFGIQQLTFSIFPPAQEVLFYPIAFEIIEE